MDKLISSCQDCPFLNLNIMQDPRAGRLGHPDNYRINCRLQPNVILSQSGDNWQPIFENCPLKSESITVAIEEPNPERSVATDAK